MSDTPNGDQVERVLAEAEEIRRDGKISLDVSPSQAGATSKAGTGGGSPSPAPPAWQDYLNEANLCAVYGDKLLSVAGCQPLAPAEREQAVQAWAECLAKWFPSVREWMGPELRLLTIYGVPVVLAQVDKWTTAPSPESSGGADQARPH